MEEKEVITRYSPPTRYDNAPFGTLCKVIDDGNTPKLFIQLNQEPDNNSWYPLSYLLETIFSEHIQRSEFIQACLDAYLSKNKESLIKLSDVLKN